MKIVSSITLTPERRERILDLVPGAQLVQVAGRGPEGERIEAARDAEIWVSRGMTPGVFKHANKLKWVYSSSAGVEHWLFPELIESDVIVTNSSGIHADSCSDHALMGMLYFARNLPAFLEGQRQRRWRRFEVSVSELSGLTLGVIGLGDIGRAVARRGRVVGMHVIGVRRSGKPVPEADETYGPRETTAIFARSDFVVIACPHTHETHGLVGAEELHALGPRGYLINVARGGIIDTPALIEALERGTIAGAALDAFEEEPLPSDSPLWTTPNTLITPHSSSSMRDYAAGAFELFLGNLEQYVNGEPMTNVVDKQLGY